MALAFQSAASGNHKNVETEDILDRRLSRKKRGIWKLAQSWGWATAKVMKVEYLIADNENKAKAANKMVEEWLSEWAIS